MANDFVTEVGDGLPQVDEIFFTKDDGETFERVSTAANGCFEYQHLLERIKTNVKVLQSLHVLRNLSFMHENAQLFARSNTLLLVLAKGLALPQASYYIEIQQHCLDIFENISHLVGLRGVQDFFLACLKKMVPNYS